MAQFIVDQRQQLSSRARLTGLDGRNDLRDLAHEPTPISFRGSLRAFIWPNFNGIVGASRKIIS